MPTTATIQDVNRLFDRAMSTVQAVQCVDRQLECWDLLKTLIPSFPLDIGDPKQDAVPGFCDSLYDWLPTLEVDLGELAASQPAYVARYVSFMEDMVTKIIAEDHRQNFQRSYAEALGLAARVDEAEQVIARLLEEAPKDEWTWLTWGDLYLDSKTRDPARALDIFRQAIANGVDNETGQIQDRVATLEGPAKAQAVSTKVGRNDPCTCGSGKKYKKCCGA